MANSRDRNSDKSCKVSAAVEAVDADKAAHEVPEAATPELRLNRRFQFAAAPFGRRGFFMGDRSA
jgi:hypothetical protein